MNLVMKILAIRPSRSSASNIAKLVDSVQELERDGLRKVRDGVEQVAYEVRQLER